MRSVGDSLGVSAPYLHDVEHNRRRLPLRRWGALVAAIPTLSISSLAAAFVLIGRIDVDASMLTEYQRDVLASALEAEARAANP